jgi:hypothetical protein
MVLSGSPRVLMPHHEPARPDFILRRAAMNKYVLKTDERMPSKNNFWAIEAATSPEEARRQFRRRIETSYCASENHYLQSREEDRKRRLREDDFDIEVL